MDYQQCIDKRNIVYMHSIHSSMLKNMSLDHFYILTYWGHFDDFPWSLLIPHAMCLGVCTCGCAACPMLLCSRWRWVLGGFWPSSVTSPVFHTSLSQGLQVFLLQLEMLTGTELLILAHGHLGDSAIQLFHNADVDVTSTVVIIMNTGLINWCSTGDEFNL